MIGCVVLALTLQACVEDQAVPSHTALETVIVIPDRHDKAAPQLLWVDIRQDGGVRYTYQDRQAPEGRLLKAFKNAPQLANSLTAVIEPEPGVPEAQIRSVADRLYEAGVGYVTQRGKNDKAILLPRLPASKK